VLSYSNSVKFDVDLDIDFVNVGTQPIVFLSPQQEPQAEIFQVEGIALALSKLQAETYPYGWDIWARGMFTSISTAPEYGEVARRLDQSSPPPDLTRVLRSRESWTWRTTVALWFEAHTVTAYVNRTPSPSDLGWDVIGKIGTPLWMRLRYSVWSHNLQRADRNLRARLQKRWRNAGYLIVEPELDTQAIELRLNEVKLNDSP